MTDSPETFDLKNDQYRKSRPGQIRFYNLYCTSCGHHVCLYQKDGRGSLIRLYNDRVVAPDDVMQPNPRELRCKHCSTLLGTAYIYEKEQRPAFSILPGAIARKVTKGLYPPALLKLS